MPVGRLDIYSGKMFFFRGDEEPLELAGGLTSTSSCIFLNRIELPLSPTYTYRLNDDFLPKNDKNTNSLCGTHYVLCMCATKWRTKCKKNQYHYISILTPVTPLWYHLNSRNSLAGSKQFQCCYK